MGTKLARGSDSAGHRIAVALIAMSGGLSCASGVHAAPDRNGTSGGSRGPADVEAARQLSSVFAEVAKRASRAVVSIRVEQRQKMPKGPHLFDFFGRRFGRPEQRERVLRGRGSGVVIRSDGYVLTNNHVVEDATHIEVHLQDDRRFDGRLIGNDPATDLAVVKVDAKNLPAVEFADAAEVRVGQWVLAIGSPFGLDYTTTVGVVSAKGRAVGANEIEDYIQTDAMINPGNSGGPLIDLDGEVVGVNTMIAGRGTGIGFAVPSNIAQNVANQLIERGNVRRPWIGVTFQELTPRLAERLGVEQQGGALVSRVMPGGPADQAGIRAGDVVTAVDGKNVEEGRDLLRHVLAADVGETIEMTIVREGKKRKVEVTTGERPRDAGRGGPSERGGEPKRGLGMQLQPLTPGLARRLGLPSHAQGVVVANVKPGSPADRAGLEDGDVIVEADRKPVGSPSDVRKALKDGSALLRVRRGDGAMYVVLSRD